MRELLDRFVAACNVASNSLEIIEYHRLLTFIQWVEANAPEYAAAPELLAACEAEQDADEWDRALHEDTIAAIKKRRIPIHQRWSAQIEQLGYLHFNDSVQLRYLANKLRQAAIAKAKGAT